MRLSAETHREVEEFFRRYTGDARLTLPPIEIHAGRLADAFTRVNRISGITFGRHVFVSSRVLQKDAEGRATISGRLLVHEAAHVLQYERRGWLRFLRGYLGGYWRALREAARWDGEGRQAAYLAIAEECEARRAEDAYAAEKR